MVWTRQQHRLAPRECHASEDDPLLFTGDQCLFASKRPVAKSSWPLNTPTHIHSHRVYLTDNLTFLCDGRAGGLHLLLLTSCWTLKSENHLKILLPTRPILALSKAPTEVSQPF